MRRRSRLDRDRIFKSANNLEAGEAIFLAPRSGFIPLVIREPRVAREGVLVIDGPGDVFRLPGDHELVRLKSEFGQSDLASFFQRLGHLIKPL